MDTPSPADDLNKRSFSVARKGYDRDEVDSFRDEAVRMVREAESAVAAMRETLEQLGLTEGVLVRDELDAIGSEVKGILQAAREAAENMRTRAAEDAGRWRNEADAEARTTRTEATDASEMLRASAWDSANEMIAAAKEQAESMMRSAQEDALFLRAEAEREAVRLTGDARQDSETLVRETKRDAEMLLTAAREESEQLLLDAHQAAESAQQRARALEERRAELMAELEMARQSIGEISSAAQTPPEAVAPPPQPEFARSPEPGGWANDDGSVRVIGAERGAPMPTDPVDALAMADEVAALRQTRHPGKLFDGGDAADDADEGTAEDVATSVPVVKSPDDETEESTDVPEPPATESSPSRGDDEVTDDEAATSEEPPPEAETAVGAEPEQGPEPEPESVPTPDETPRLDALFASLREVPPEPEPSAEPVADTAVSEPVAEQPQPESAPEPVLSSPPQTEVSPSGPSTTTDSDGVSAVEEFEAGRDRLLLPLENRTLRVVKRHIVAVQNHALEALRTSDQQWRPTRKDIDKALIADIDQLVSEAFLAGYSSEAQRRGVAAPQPPRKVKRNAGKDFADALVAAIDEALEEAVASGAGARQVASAASKVFRAWRTDEAERKLRAAARSAYADGIDVL